MISIKGCRYASGNGQGGEAWRSRLYERLRWVDAVVCVVTSASVASTWCTAEVSSALVWGSRLVPIVAERGVVHPLLSDIQHIDLAGNPEGGPLALAEALRRVDARGGWGWPDDRSPFPGLRPLDVADHRVFFGRGAEVEQVAGLLRSPVERADLASAGSTDASHSVSGAQSGLARAAVWQSSRSAACAECE